MPTHYILHFLLQPLVSLLFLAALRGFLFPPPPRQERAECYRKSVTQEEIQTGLAEACLRDKSGRSTAVLQRRLVGITHASSSAKAPLFTDVTAGGTSLDADAAGRLAELRASVLDPSAVPSGQVQVHEVAWDPAEGVSLGTHADYLRTSLDAFSDVLARSVLDAARAQREAGAGGAGGMPDPLVSEVASHLHLALDKEAVHVGREEALAPLRDFLLGSGAAAAAAPAVMVLHAESGAGKTSLLAKAALDAAGALHQRHRDSGGSAPPPAVVLRFLGTSSDSASVPAALRSLAAQLGALSGQDADAAPSEMGALLAHLRQLLAAAPQGGGTPAPLVMVLDSLDQLRAEEGRPLSNWLSRLLPLPSHVRLLVSTLPDDSQVRIRRDALKPGLRGIGMPQIRERFLETRPVSSSRATSGRNRWQREA